MCETLTAEQINAEEKIRKEILGDLYVIPAGYGKNYPENYPDRLGY